LAWQFNRHSPRIGTIGHERPVGRDGIVERRRKRVLGRKPMI